MSQKPTLESVTPDMASAVELCNNFGDLVVMTQFSSDDSLEMAFAHMGLHGGYGQEAPHVQEFLKALGRFFQSEIESRKPRKE